MAIQMETNKNSLLWEELVAEYAAVPSLLIPNISIFITQSHTSLYKECLEEIER